MLKIVRGNFYGKYKFIPAGVISSDAITEEQQQQIRQQRRRRQLIRLTNFNNNITVMIIITTTTLHIRKRSTTTTKKQQLTNNILAVSLSQRLAVFLTRQARCFQQLRQTFDKSSVKAHTKSVKISTNNTAIKKPGRLTKTRNEYEIVQLHRFCRSRRSFFIGFYSSSSSTAAAASTSSFCCCCCCSPRPLVCSLRSPLP